MRPALLLLALVACSAPPELTDDQKAALMTNIRARIARLPDELGLSQEQYHATRPIVAEMREGVVRAVSRARKSGPGLSTGARLKRDLKQVRSDTEEKLKPILSEDQMQSVQRCFDDIRITVKNAGLG